MKLITYALSLTILFLAFLPRPILLKRLSQHISWTTLKLPKFDIKNALHLKLAKASEHAHQLKEGGTEYELGAVEREIDKLAAELWGITTKELGQIQKALKQD
jgi:hypothetical protein